MPNGWVQVPLVTTGDLWTAANHNTYIRNNQQALADAIDQHASQHAAGGSDPVIISPEQISPQGKGSGLDADTLQGRSLDGLWTSYGTDSIDWNSVVTAGLYDLLLHGTLNPNGPGVSAYFHVIVARYASAVERLLQLAVPTVANDGTLKSIFYRGYNQQAGTWTNWREIFDTYNSAVGSNANGQYVRFPNGLQICWRGPFATQGTPITWTFPAVFVSAPAVVVAGAWGDGLTKASLTNDPTTAGVSIATAVTSAQAARSVHALAIGRWK